MALGFGLLTGVIFHLRSGDGRRDALRSGVGLALALWAATFVWPRATRVLGLSPDLAKQEAIVVAIFGIVLSGYFAYVVLRRLARWIPSEAYVSAAVVIVVLVSVKLYGVPSPSGDSPPTLSDRSADPSAPNVLLLVLDTVRADHLSIYGYERETTPELAGLLERNPRAVLYPLAFSPAPFTVPAHASLFTGLLPTPQVMAKGIPGQTTLAEVLRENGYRTAAIVSNINLKVLWGGERGFDLFAVPAAPQKISSVGEGLRKHLMPTLLADVIKCCAKASEINEEVIRVADTCVSGPCFIMANYMEAHHPYLPEPPYKGMFSSEKADRSLVDAPVVADTPATTASHLPIQIETSSTATFSSVSHRGCTMKVSARPSSAPSPQRTASTTKPSRRPATG